MVLVRLHYWGGMCRGRFEDYTPNAPSVQGCPHNCESECTRGDIYEPIAIDEVKEFIADQELKSSYRFITMTAPSYGKKMAVIGADHAGLACAYYLAIDGYKVPVFEKPPVPGVMMTLGIPSLRLEKGVSTQKLMSLRICSLNSSAAFRLAVMFTPVLSLQLMQSQQVKGNCSLPRLRCHNHRPEPLFRLRYLHHKVQVRCYPPHQAV